MNEILDPINIIILIVGAVVLYRLVGVLGQKTGNEEPPPAPRRRDGQRPDDAPARPESRVESNVIPLAPARREEAGDDERSDAPETALDRALRTIVSADRQFDKAEFLEGARMAYEMIVVAFAKGDKRTLKPLLSPEVYQGFAGAIDERASRGETVETTFVGLDQAEIVEAETQGRLARIKVRFVSKMINVTRDRAGEVVSGDPSRIDTLHDGWTFERMLGTSDPNWVLVATETTE